MTTSPLTTHIDIVFSDAQHPDSQHCVSVSVPLPCTVIQAIDASNIAQRYPDLDLTACAMGIYGRQATLETHLSPYDRIEIYRPLIYTHHEARRKRATPSH